MNVENYKKILIYFFILFALIGLVIGTISNSKYEAIRFGNSSFLLPNRVAEGANRSEGEDYVFLQSEDYLVLGIGSDPEDIDSSVLGQFNITNEELAKLKSVKREYDLLQIVGFDEGRLVDSGKTNKPSYDKYFIQYRTSDCDEIILFYTSDEKNLIEIIIAPQNDISTKEIVKMHGTMRIHK